MNYHPEKEARMQATIAFYRDKDASALRAWNGGEGRNTGGCEHKVGIPTSAMPRLTPSRALASMPGRVSKEVLFAS